MTLHFEQILKDSTINHIAESYGFTSPENLEKFIMDFEMYYHISKEMECIIRGGMCMPFYTNERVRRLSIDIDLITSRTVDDTKIIMEKVGDRIPEIELVEKNPKKKYPIDNLLSYDVKYMSCFGVSDKIKVDFLCGVDIELPTETIKNNFHILGFNIDYSPKALSFGALIGDKLTTLALNKIGLPERRFGDIPKQIYDIATLLKTVPLDELKIAFDTFMNFTDYKVQIYNIEPKYKIKDVINSINDSIYIFLDFESTVTLTSLADSRYNSFKNRYLGNAGEQYKKLEHITDLLIVFLFSKLISKNSDNKISSEDAAVKFIKIIQEINMLKDMDDQERRQFARQDILENLSELPFNRNVLNGPPIEQVFLIKEIFHT